MPTFEYALTEDLEVRANQQHFRVLLGYRWIGVVVCYVMGAGLFFLTDVPAFHYAGLFSLAAAVCLTVLLWSTRAFLLRTARKFFSQLEDPTVHVEYDDDGFEWRYEQGSRKTRWRDVTRRVETRDFHLLYQDKVPVAAVPKELMDAETLAFVIAKVP